MRSTKPDPCASHPQRLSAPLSMHFNIFQLFNIYYLCCFVLLISYSWPEEMYWRALECARSLFFEGAMSTTAPLKHTLAAGPAQPPGALERQETQTSHAIPSQWLSKGHQDVFSQQERRHSRFWKVQELFHWHTLLISAETSLRKFT